MSAVPRGWGGGSGAFLEGLRRTEARENSALCNGGCDFGECAAVWWEEEGGCWAEKAIFIRYMERKREDTPGWTAKLKKHRGSPNAIRKAMVTLSTVTVTNV